MRPEDMGGMNFLSQIIQILILASILLYARKNMAGWDIPLRDVLLSFKGRLNRKAYWLKGAVFMALIQAVLGFLIYLTAWPLFYVFPSALPVYAASTFLIMLPFFAFSIWASFAISIKRLHDLDLSGWFMLLALIPIVNIWLIIKIGFFRGTKGTNRYGPDLLDELGEEYTTAEHHDAPGTPPSETIGGGFGHRGNPNARRKQAFPSEKIDRPKHEDHTGENEHDLITRRLGVRFDDDIDEPK